ncbi:probable N-acetyltransferase HLS1 [Nymphaea colorata]|nr:probable N-acetyltransferase HLS1 [Nymphaea colorata]
MAGILVREFDEERDSNGVTLLESMCEVGPSGKTSLVADLMGDPLARVRHSPSYLMLVAEYGDDSEIVGVIRGCIKTVTRGAKRKQQNSDVPLYVKVAYILGLRVSPSHRRAGVGSRLVQRMEEWFEEEQADYAYMATENTNTASLGLFTGKFGYTMFRAPTVLVHPVHAHAKPVDPQVDLVEVPVDFATALYRHAFETAEFFPKDIDSVLSNRLTLGTFVAVQKSGASWVPGAVPSRLPDSYAMASVWNCSEVFQLEVKGASPVVRAFAKATRLADRLMPCLRIPSVPDVFQPFGVHVVYGLHVEGKEGAKLMSELWWHVYNLAREGGALAIAAEVGPWDPAAKGIPHWQCFSCAEDVWCIKALNDEDAPDWICASPTSTMAPLFVDPRDF